MSDTTRHWLSVLVAISVISMLGIGAVGPALAEETNETEEDEIEEQPTEISAQLGDLDIHSVDWDHDEHIVEMQVTWRGDRPTTVSSMELIDPDTEMDMIGIDQTRVVPGDETVIRVSMSEEFNGVIVSTPESIEEQDALVLTPDPEDSRQVSLLWGVLLGVALGGTGTAYAAVKRQRTTKAVERASDKDGGLL